MKPIRNDHSVIIEFRAIDAHDDEHAMTRAREMLIALVRDAHEYALDECHIDDDDPPDRFDDDYRARYNVSFSRDFH